MPRKVPTQIVNLIDRYFPWAKDWKLGSKVQEREATLLSRYNEVLGRIGIESFNVRRFKAVFQENGDLLKQMDSLAIRGAEWNVDGADENDEEDSTGAGASESQLRIVGTVARLVPETNYGFIRGDDGAEWFFHRGEMQVAQDWLEMKPGKKVSFQIGGNRRGGCAIKVAPLQ